MKYGYLKFLILVLTFAILSIKGVISLDPDFGWHLKMGQLIQVSGIPKKDPFSYTMPSYPFVDHEWLTNVVFTKLYSLVGKAGLAIFSTAIVVLALAITATNPLSRGPKRVLNKRYYLSTLLVLGLAVALPFSGVRPQVESWLFLALLLRIVLDKAVWRKWRFAVPSFILLWTNLHGSFAMGLVVLVFVVITRSFRRRSFHKDEMLILILSIVVTFINPYGWRIWWEVKQQITDTQLRWNIVEWMPAVFMVDFSFITFVTLSTLLVWRFRKKIYLEELGLYLVVLIQALLSRRHVPLWLIVSLPLTINLLDCLYQEVKNIPHAPARFKKLLKYAWTGSFIVLIFQIVFALRGAYFLSEDKFYPGQAISFIRQDLPEGQIFSKYGWGGYLIWKLPEKKVFIDGRMPSWRWDNNPPQESGAAFDDYLSLLEGEISYEEVFEKYTIDTVLWPVSVRPGFYGYLQSKLDEFLARLGGERRDFSLLEELEKDKWEEIYKDSVAVIYKKPN